MPSSALPPRPTPGARPPSRGLRSLDAVTTRRAHEMVAWRGGFDASGVTVEVRGGTATLAGTVASDRDAAEARRLAASVWGVREVRDQLRVERRDAPAVSLGVAVGGAARSGPGTVSRSSFMFDGPATG